MNDENTLWMGDIEPWMDQATIINSFKYFNIFPINVKLIKDKKKNRNKTYCFVTFKNIQEATNALNLNGNKLPTANINFKLNWADYQTNSTKTAYVGNLNSKINDSELYKLFSAKYKSVHHANVITENGKSKGYGFVTFKNEEDYLKSLKEMNGINYYGNNIKVREKRKKDEDNNYNNGNNINNINNNINLNKNRDRNKNAFFDFNKGKINSNFLNNNTENNINSINNINNIPFIYQNNINNNNNINIQDSEKRFNDIRNNNIINTNYNTNISNSFSNNLNKQLNFINNNNLINDINKINNAFNNKNNIINFNTIQNINIINSNGINNNNINDNNKLSSIEYLLNKRNQNNNNPLIFENNIINNKQNISKINNLKYKKDNTLQYDKNNINSNDLININNRNKIGNINEFSNINLQKEQLNKVKNTNNNIDKKNSNDNNSNNDNKRNTYKLEILEKIDEITLCKKIHESIQRTFEYHKKMFMSNGIKFKSK